MGDAPLPGAYAPFVSARRPGGFPEEAPLYRVMVHRQYVDLWAELETRIGTPGAQEFWDHVATSPGSISGTAKTTILRGKAGKPKRPGWSRTYHFEVSGAGRIDYQFDNAHRTTPDGDEHRAVFILTISYSSH
ncbi:hypothetical protein [Curtobacterium sp. MCSS17_005]|uniref:hypothetical protein n=1 Tax=Curtobacterium sp. MCSS17_005 TaxID=2175641 RepID=UPI0011B38588|nr:hypothetical protein [Curtobacterium sp. MCSS17_005]WIB34402.1 hypothetical protein DEJ20_08025 [Curtobacterium sp. MCSS17_005]